MQIVSVHRFNITGVVGRHFVPVRISCLDIVSVNTLQIFIVLIFKTVQPLAVATGKPDHMRAEGAAGVISGALRLQIDHGLQIVLVDVFSDGVCRILIDFPLDGSVQIFGVFGNLLVYLVITDPKNLGKTRRNQLCVIGGIAFLQIVLRAFDSRRRDKHAVGGDIGGKNVAVPIVDLSAVGRHCRFRGDLIENLGLIFIEINGLDH